MIIQGPFNFQPIEITDNQAREIQIAFTSEFQTLDLSEQIQQLDAHISHLQSLLSQTGPRSPDYQGIAKMNQFAQGSCPEFVDSQF